MKSSTNLIPKLNPKEFSYEEKDLLRDFKEPTLSDFIMNYFNLEQLSLNDMETILKKGANQNGFNFITNVSLRMLIDSLDLKISQNIENIKKNSFLRKKFKIAIVSIICLNRLIRVRKEIFPLSLEINPLKTNFLKKFKKSFGKTFYKENVLHLEKIQFMVLFSIILIMCFFINFYLSSLRKNSELLSIGFLIARGAAFSIIILTMFILLTMSRKFITNLHKTKFNKYFSFFFDEHRFIHQICGFFLVFYSFIHISGHLLGTFMKLKEKNIAEKFSIQPKKLWKFNFFNNPWYNWGDINNNNFINVY